MSINRVPIGGIANNQYHGQGQFCYYRKGSAVSGITDVAVYVDSAYMGLMSPTEHFSLNRKGEFWEFKPVDPLLVGEFVLADTAEEYGSSAVAGTVAISGGSLVIDSGNVAITNFPATQNVAVTSAVTKKQLASANGRYFDFSGSTFGVTVGTTLHTSLINPIGSGKKVFVDFIRYKIQGNSATNSVAMTKYEFTGNWTGTPPLNPSLGDAPLSTITVCPTYSAASATALSTLLAALGLTITGGTGHFLNEIDIQDPAHRYTYFDGAICLRPGQMIDVAIAPGVTVDPAVDIFWWEE